MSAVGILIGQGGNHFTGTFVAQKNIVLLTGTFSQSVVPFLAPGAIVKYKNVSDFKGTYDIEFFDPRSFVGETTVDITFVNDSSVKLPLKGIIISQTRERQVITGFGTFILIPIP
ncbi:hypothetical protein F5887DRAFT_982951 [Amanita rubescens]|nr:hypothetical protein F5887DRAFT_982951 [Amanita rubescens]